MEVQSKCETLDGDWRIVTDPGNVGVVEAWFDREIPMEAEKAVVPGVIQQTYPGYRGVVWYWLAFQSNMTPFDDERAFIHFEAVDYYAEVWLDGIRLGGHEGGELPFALDATEVLRQRKDHILTVRVINPTKEGIEEFVLDETPSRCKVDPYRVGAAYNHGGIVGPVEIRCVPDVRIGDVYVQSQVNSGDVRLEITLVNDRDTACNIVIRGMCGPSKGTKPTVVVSDRMIVLSPGETLEIIDFNVPRARLWSPDDPFQYELTLQIFSETADLGSGSTSDGTAAGCTPRDTHRVRFGFRELRVDEDGFFNLNGRRIFIRSSHTVNDFPVGVLVPPSKWLEKRDLLYAKASGHNMIRFIAGVATPEQLDYCDEIGLMVYEECFAAWCLTDSPQVGKRYDDSVLGMVRRDRNHASIVIWGLLNETRDGSVFEQAQNVLPKLRSLDPTRLVLINSGRWDGKASVGSISNPGSCEWEHVWGKEAPDADISHSVSPGGYWEDAGDAHAYPIVPHTSETIAFLRNLGQGMKPVFLSEYGIGSLVNAVRVTRLFEQEGARQDLEDAALYRSMADRFEADWKRWGMDDVYPFPEDMLRESLERNAEWRRLGLAAIRSNPRICGYNLTGTVDQVMAGEGLWTTWGELKSGTIDALVEGFAPLYWCLFVEPRHVFAGRAFTVDAVLANEGILNVGAYPVTLRIWGSKGTIWERRVELTIHEGNVGFFSVPVLSEQVVIETPGEYIFAAQMESGGAPTGGRLKFRVSEPVPDVFGNLKVEVAGIDQFVRQWLHSVGVRTEDLALAQDSIGENVEKRVILLGDLSRAGWGADQWRQLVHRINAGSIALFLDPNAFSQGENSVAWLPLREKGRHAPHHNWLYHREDVAKRHVIFNHLQGPGILDWVYYGDVIPRSLFIGQSSADEVVAAAFGPGVGPDGYTSGVILSRHMLGSGSFLLNTFRVLAELEKNPAANRLLANLIEYGQTLVGAASPQPLDDLNGFLDSIGYPS